MKRILESGMLVMGFALMVVGVTGAFFSDSETSVGNVFAAGALDLKVDSQAHYAGLVCTDIDTSSEENWVWVKEGETTTRPDLEGDPCDGSWELTDLGPSYKFFNLSDLKPGDSGENTISLHVYDNRAYACAIIDNMTDEEVGTCMEPESEDGDTTCTNGAQGELADDLRFFAWAETDGDNVWEPDLENVTIEPKLFANTEGPASDVIDGVAYELFAPNLNGGLTTDPSQTQYIGMYWCYGAISVDPAGATFEDRLKCNGAPVDNLSQSDKLSADITFYVEQARNNAGFECPEPRKPEAQIIPGSGWSPVLPSKVWFAEVRNNNSEYEVAIGLNDGGPQQDTDDTTWVAGIDNTFMLEYDGIGTATFTTGGETVTYAIPDAAYTRIGINVKAPDTVTTEIKNLELTGVAPLVPNSLSVTGPGENKVESLTIVAPVLAGVWKLSGQFSFSAVGAPYPQDFPAILFTVD